MRHTRPICLFLAVLTLLFPALAGCSGGDGKDPALTDTAPASDVVSGTDAPETDAPVTFAPDEWHDLPADLDFDGAEFVIGNCGWEPPLTLDGEEENGEQYHDAKYDVRKYPEDLLNVKMRQILSPVSAFEYWMSGEDEIEVWMMVDRFAYRDALENIFIPLSGLSYIDTSKKYWYSDSAELLAFGDFEFMTIGSFDWKSFLDVGCMFMNLAVAEDIHVEVPYDLVDEGKWTFDALARYKGVYTRDLDGNNHLTGADQTTFGSLEGMMTPVNFLAAADVQIMGKDEDNLPIFLCFGDEKLIDVLMYVKGLFFDPLDSVADKKLYDETMCTTPMFTDDRNLIVTGSLNHMRSLREMESPYAVLPTPKYDESQQKYYSRMIEPRFSLISNYVKDPDMVGAVLEAMSAYGYQYFVPTLIETCLQFKYNNDPNSVKNIRLVFDSRTVSLSDMLCEEFIDGYIWDQMFRDSSFASWFASRQSKAEAALAKDLKDIKAIIEELNR